jgi:hypothetical protein
LLKELFNGHGPILDTEPEPEPEQWTIRYTAELDDAQTATWGQTVNWATDDRNKTAANLLLAGLVGECRNGVVVGGAFYLPHRINKITWEVP